VSEIVYLPEDHAAAQRLHARPSRVATFVAAAAAAGVLIGLYATDPEQRFGFWAFIWMPFAAVFGGWLVLRLIAPLQAQRRFASDKAAGRGLDITLESDGIRTRNERGENLIRWREIVRWRADARTVLVYLSPRLFLHFPTRLAAQGFPIEALRQALQKEVGPPS